MLTNQACNRYVVLLFPMKFPGQECLLRKGKEGTRQGDTLIHFVETVKISDRSQSEVISFIELRHIYGFVLLS